MRTLLLIYTLATVSIHAQQLVFENNLSATLAAVDTKGNIYVANSGTVTKLNPDGSTSYSKSLAFSATLAGIAVDSLGNLVIAGTTSDDTLPTTSAVLQPKRNSLSTCVAPGPTAQVIPCPDAFVAKLDPAGNLLWATYLGGSAPEQANGVAVDSSGNIFIVGLTNSSNFPTVSALQTKFGGDADGFITKISPDGSKILYSSFIGGTMHDIAHAVAVDPDGNAYVAGEGQIGIPSTAGSFGKDCANTGVHAFLLKVSPTGSMVYGGCIGSAGTASAATAVAVDSTDNAYIGGATTATDFPLTSGAFDGRTGVSPSDFIAKVSADGASLVYSALLDGASPGVYSIAVDSSGAAYAAGATASSSTMPVTGPALQPCTGPSNAAFNFLLKLNPAGSTLNYFSFENGLQPAISIAVGTDGSLIEAAGLVRKFSSLAAAGGLYLSPLCVLNGASFISHFQFGQPGISPGEFVTLEGAGLGPGTGVSYNPAGTVPTTLGGTQVLFDGVPAPIVYAQDRQVNVIAPYALSTKTQTSIQIVYQGKTSKAVTVPVSPISVAPLSDPQTGRPQVLNGDLSPNSIASPATAGSVVIVFVTGAGQTVPPSLDGQITQGPGMLGVTTSAVLQNRSNGLVSLPISLIYAGPAPGKLAAIQEIKVQIPSDLPSYFLSGAGLGQTYLLLSFGSQAISVPVVIH